MSRADQATTERAKVLVPFGFTERQACFLVTVMSHSGVFVGRQYAALAGITHGHKMSTIRLFESTGRRRSGSCTGESGAEWDISSRMAIRTEGVLWFGE